MQPIKAMFGQAPEIDIPAGSYERNELSPADATCTITFNSSGAWSVTDDSGTAGTWLTGAAASKYEIIWNNTSGTLSSGTTGSYQDFPQSFGVTFTALNGSKTCTGDVSIRRKSDSVVVAGPESITITARVTP